MATHPILVATVLLCDLVLHWTLPSSVCRSGPLLLQPSLLSAATAALPLGALSVAVALVDCIMTSSSDEITVVDSSSTFICTTDDDGWAKYGFSDAGSDTSKKVGRKKVVKAEVEKKDDEVEKKDEEEGRKAEEHEKSKENELVDKLNVMHLKPVTDPTPSKESLLVDSSPPDVSSRKSLCPSLFQKPMLSQLLWNR